jgi:chromosome segregation ATPase
MIPNLYVCSSIQKNNNQDVYHTNKILEHMKQQSEFNNRMLQNNSEETLKLDKLVKEHGTMRNNLFEHKKTQSNFNQFVSDQLKQNEFVHNHLKEKLHEHEYFNQEVKKDFESFNCSLTDFKSDLDSCKTNVGHLKNELKNFKILHGNLSMELSKISNKMHDNNKLQSDFNEWVSNQIANLEVMHSYFVKKLNNQISLHQETINLLKEKHTDLDHQLHSFKTNINNLKNQMNEFEVMYNKLFQEQKVINKDFFAHKQTQAAHNERVATEIEHHELVHEKSGKQLNNQTIFNQDIIKRFEQLKAGQINLSQHLDDQYNRVNNLTNQINDLEVTDSKLSQEQIRLNDDFFAHRKRQLQLNEWITKKIDHHELARTDLDSQLNEQNNLHQGVIDRFEELKENITQLVEQINSQQENVDDLKVHITEYEGKYNTLSDTLVGQSNHMKELKNEITNYESMCNELLSLLHEQTI